MTKKQDQRKQSQNSTCLLREKEYYEMLRCELESRKGENVDITFREVRKNNGVRKKACTVRYDDAQVAPTIYLDTY